MSDSSTAAGLTEGNGAIPVIFSKKVALEYTKLSNKTIDNLTNDQYEGEIKAEGDRVRIVLPNVEAIEIADGDSCPVPQSTPPEALDLIIDKQKTFALSMTDKEKAQTQFKNWLDGMANGVAQKIGKVKNMEIQRAIFEYTAGSDVAQNAATAAPNNGAYDFDNHPLAGEFGTDSNPLDVNPQNIFSLLLQVKMALFDSGAIASDGTYNFAPLNGETQEMRGVFICGSRLAAILLSAYQLAGRSTDMVDIVVKDGEVARVAGLDVHIDRTLDEVTTTAGASYVDTRVKFTNLPFIAGTKNAITKASQISKVEHIRDPYCFQDIVRGMELYGFKIVHPEALVRGVVKKLSYDEFNASVPVTVVAEPTQPTETTPTSTGE